MKNETQKLTATLLLTAGLLAVVLLALQPAQAHPPMPFENVPAASPIQEDPTSSDRVLVVSVFYQGEWLEIGALPYDKYLTKQHLDLPPVIESGPVLVRVEHTGRTAAHIDTILLGHQHPDTVEGTSEAIPLALKKLARRDYDVIDVEGKLLTFTFNLAAEAAPLTLSLVARIEPEVISTIPFQFPKANYYQTMSPTSAFYTYRWDSSPGRLTVDGHINDEQLGQPFMREWSHPEFKRSTLWVNSGLTPAAEDMGNR